MKPAWSARYSRTGSVVIFPVNRITISVGTKPCHVSDHGFNQNSKLMWNCLKNIIRNSLRNSEKWFVKNKS